ncbi:MAG: hypothetical protein ABII00_15800 [Elusimicrobiota bacterium]
MDNPDVFESVFKRAIRQSYEHCDIRLDTILLVTDLDPKDIAAYESKVRQLFGAILPSGKSRWISLHKHNYIGWAHLRAHIERHEPSLIVTYRLLQEVHDNTKSSLGAFLDTMARALRIPVLVLPDPDGETAIRPGAACGSVMVVTSHLCGAHSLVNYGVRFTAEGGELTFCHLEDQDIFDRYLAAIEKIPEISTDVAREHIRRQLLVEPRQYIESVTQILQKRRPDIRVQGVIEIGHIIDRCRELIRTREADFVILALNDAAHLAMPGAGYSLAVELKDIPLLLV